ncbi:MAG: hypothetical protein K2J82_11150 [Muribaculaceae bacterium]|nr:hypothetical protein [Muribaculaceae bacterium]MDE6755152.1 hypothetical protein [Muribaculaceae bacterium]
MNHDKISSGINSQEKGFNRLLEEAAAESRRISLAIQKIAGTTSCKGVQIHGLKKWAIENQVWISDISKLGEFSDRGSENEVYMDAVHQVVNKLNNFRYADDNLEPFFQRINIHNKLFPDCAYILKGFAENQDGKTCAVLEQPFIRADREASIEEIAGALALMGFIPMCDGEFFTNGEVDIFDALPNNVLHGIDGNLYFIDTICLLSNDNYLDIYKSLSPHWRIS